MSKSRGTFIKARTYLDHLHPDYLRYYYAAKLGSGTGDIDLNLDDFVQRVNSDVVGKVVNIASRCAGFIGKRFGGQLGDGLPEPELFQRFVQEEEAIAADFESRNYQAAVRRIMALADEANRYIDEKKPWVMIKETGREAEVQAVCTQGLNLFRVLITYLAPVLPAMAEKVQVFLNLPALRWDDIAEPLLDHRIEKFQPLMTRIEPASVEAMVAASREHLEATAALPAAAIGKASASRSASTPDSGPMWTVMAVMRWAFSRAAMDSRPVTIWSHSSLVRIPCCASILA